MFTICSLKTINKNIHDKEDWPYNIVFDDKALRKHCANCELNFAVDTKIGINKNSGPKRTSSFHDINYNFLEYSGKLNN